MAVSLIIFLLIFLAYATFSVVLFYHFSRYSLIGDLSKTAFFVYIFSGSVILFVGLAAIILNHLLNA